jgi:hypothetical protein
MSYWRSIVEAVTETEIPPTPALPITDDERNAIDNAIAGMALVGRGRGVYHERPRPSEILMNEELCKATDKLIAEVLTSVRKVVPEDTAEKFFERMSKVVDDWKDYDEQMTLAVIFFRLLDTMRFLVAYRGKFRGKARTSSMSKDDALAELKVRGLTNKR